MNGLDWTAVSVIVSIGGGLMFLLLAHTRTLSRIESVVRGLADRADENRDDHQAMWSQISRHGETLADHRSRILQLERHDG